MLVSLSYFCAQSKELPSFWPPYQYWPIVAFKIYTKTGDKGATGLFGGARVPKHHIRIESYGTIDELNAHVGLLRDLVLEEDIKAVLKEIQDRLFTIGAILATDPAKVDKVKTPDLYTSDVEYLEAKIDQMEQHVPPLTSFILPGGHATVSQCHIARCVCRRAERLTVALNDLQPIHETVLPYLNRLSDYLFMLGRYITVLLEVEEVVWTPRHQG